MHSKHHKNSRSTLSAGLSSALKLTPDERILVAAIMGVALLTLAALARRADTFQPQTNAKTARQTPP